MGIKHLFKFLSEHSDNIKEINISNYYGKKIAIDISILIYQVIITIRNSGSDLVNDKGHITSHILGLFNKTIYFLNKGIIPIYVFDGKPPKLKQKTLDTRKNNKSKAFEKFNNASNVLDKIKYFKRSVIITKEQINQCKELLDLMGIPYINAIEEADSELSSLCKNNLVYAVLTEDLDILTFGAPRIIKGLYNNKKQIIELDLVNILNNLKLTHEQFIELCILFGCDYCSSICNLKPNDIFKIYSQNKSIDNTIKHIKSLGINIPNNYNYIDAKDYFNNNYVCNKDNVILELKKPDNDKLLNLLVNNYGLIKYKIIHKINHLNNLYNKFKKNDD